jgi:hypothetical protein
MNWLDIKRSVRDMQAVIVDHGRRMTPYDISHEPVLHPVWHLYGEVRVAVVQRESRVGMKTTLNSFDWVHVADR